MREICEFILFGDTEFRTVTFSRDTDWRGSMMGTRGGIVLIAGPTDIEIADYWPLRERETT